MSEERIKELEDENARLRELLDEQNRVSGGATRQLMEIAAIVFQDYPVAADFAQLPQAVRDLVAKQVSVPVLGALQLWLEAMDRRSAHSITKADERLAAAASTWFATAEAVPPFGVYAAVHSLNRALQVDPQALHELVEHRVPVAPLMASATAVQCEMPEEGIARMGVLGLINGIFGVNKEGRGWIRAVFDASETMLLRFELNPPGTEWKP